MITHRTFSNTDKIITVGSLRFRVRDIPLADIPAYLDLHQLEPYKYQYTPQVFDEVLIPKRKADDDNPNS